MSKCIMNKYSKLKNILQTKRDAAKPKELKCPPL